MLFALEHRPVQLRPQERRLILRVGRLASEAERVMLVAPTAAHAFDQIGVRVRCEVLERRRLAVLLPHEKHGYERERMTAAAISDSASRGTSVESRSPSMRFPIWSWFWAHTTNCAPLRVVGARPYLRPRKALYCPVQR